MKVEDLWDTHFLRILMAISLFFIVTKGFNWGLIFTGGVVFWYSLLTTGWFREIRGTLNQNGIASPVVQTTGSVQDVMIRLPADNNDSAIGDHWSMLQTIDPNIHINSIEFCGSKRRWRTGSRCFVYAALATLAMMLIYVGSRFEWRLGFGGIASLAHDVVITLGVFSALQVEMDLTLRGSNSFRCRLFQSTIVSWYSTVCENFGKIRRGVETIDIIDISLTQTLSRTIMTSLTTLLLWLPVLLWWSINS